jgi:hypothetical protein
MSDICDICGRSNAEIARTTADGRSVCEECDAGEDMAYTVVLLMPDYMDGDNGVCKVVHVECFDVEEAVEQARIDLAVESEVHDPDDFAVLAVFAGHHDDISE